MSDSNLFEVEYILKRRIVKGKREYLIKWKDYPENESTWEPLSHLKYVNYMIKEFEDKLRKESKNKEEKEENKEEKNDKEEEKNDKDNKKNEEEEKEGKEEKEEKEEKEKDKDKEKNEENNNDSNCEEKKSEKTEAKTNIEKEEKNNKKEKKEKKEKIKDKKGKKEKLKDKIKDKVKQKNKLLGKKRKRDEPRKKLEVRISNEKAIFEIDKTLERILTVKLDNKGLISVVERRLKNGKVLKEIMSTEDLKKTNPWILIDYYEGKIKFA